MEVIPSTVRTTTAPIIHKVGMVEPNKLVGDIGNRFTSVLSLDTVDYTILENTSLTNLILAINQQYIVVMEKIGNGTNSSGNNTVDLNELDPPIPLPQPLDSAEMEYCKIHLYQITSNTSAEFLLSCGISQITTKGYPYTLVPINYTQGADPPLQPANSTIVFLPVLL